jgi:hypothetical protein
MAAALAQGRRARPEARLVALGRVYVTFARKRPAHFRVMFGDSGTTARDPRLRLASAERTPYEQLEDAIAAWAAQRRARAVDVAGTALLLWASAHGIARLVVDGALVLDDAAIEAMLDQLTRAILAEVGSGRARRR